MPQTVPNKPTNGGRAMASRLARAGSVVVGRFDSWAPAANRNRAEQRDR